MVDGDIDSIKALEWLEYNLLRLTDLIEQAPSATPLGSRDRCSIPRDDVIVCLRVSGNTIGQIQEMIRNERASL